MMAKITVLIPDGDTSRELCFNATKWAQTAPEEPGKLDPRAGRLDLIAGRRVVVSFPLGTWMGVWYSSAKAEAHDRRF
jgi:hypothetical protein